MRKVVLYGGSFDPIHHGHLIIGRSVLEQISADELLLIPSAQPPHKDPSGLSPAMARLEMCRLAVAGECGLSVSDWEVQREGPSYTLATVEHFRASLGRDVALYWLIGEDSLVELHTWYRATELVDRCTIVTARRPGATTPRRAELETHFSAGQVGRLLEHVLETPRIDIAATNIRGRVRRGESIRYFVPEAVERYIMECGLYRGT